MKTILQARVSAFYLLFCWTAGYAAVEMPSSTIAKEGGAGAIESFAGADSDSSAVAHYVVRYERDGVFSVKATLSKPSSRFDMNYFPLEERPEGQAESVRSLKAANEDGKALDVEYVGEGAWQVREGAASHITYELVADHDLVRWGPGKDEVATRFDDTYFFAGDAFFMIDYDWPAAPIEVTFELPDGWLVTSPWSHVGNRYVAATAEDLGSNVFGMGRDAHHKMELNGLEVAWLADSRVKDVAPDIEAMMDALPAYYTAFWGGAPNTPLTVFLLSDAETDGGAFRSSFALRLATPLRDSERTIWSHTLGHELMHVWMDRSNQGISYSPDGSGYWFREGFTDYLTIKLMYQAGILKEPIAAQRIANLIRRYQIGTRLRPGLRLSEAGKDKLNNWELIYGGGAMLALLLDAQLFTSSTHGFRDMVVEVQHEPEVSHGSAEILQTLDKGSGGLASILMKRLDAGMNLHEVRALLSPAGITVEGFASDEVYVGFVHCGDSLCTPLFKQQPDQVKPRLH